MTSLMLALQVRQHHLHLHQGGRLSCDDVTNRTIWVRYIIQWVNADIKCFAYAESISLVCLDSTLSFFLVVSVESVLFSVAHSSNIFRYLPTEGKSSDCSLWPTLQPQLVHAPVTCTSSL